VIHTARPEGAADRIVSLVPSLSEALFVLGLGDRVVGVTQWCVHPAAAVARLPKLGGTKDPDLAAILALEPDLVIANKEENRRQDAIALAEAGVPVWVTDPRTVRDGADLLGEIAGLGASAEHVRRFVTPVGAAIDAAEASRPAEPVPVFCPIWKRPWMSVGVDTYAHDLLELCGAANVFAYRTDRRYPRVRDEDIVAAAPELVILPDEPCAFTEKDVQELRKMPLPAAQSGRIHMIDGTWVSWYGPRIVRAIETLRNLIVAGG
jgi:ABC-type Fe3+-hydroxamate transport system substrate-binding protein